MDGKVLTVSGYLHLIILSSCHNHAIGSKIQDMTDDDQKMNERMFLLQRLTSQKDALLHATQEIEDIRFQYVSAGNSDPNGYLEKVVWKRLQLMISAMSELNSYSNNTTNDLTRNFIMMLMQLQMASFSEEIPHLNHIILKSDFSRTVSMFANGIQIHWDIKKGPVVNFNIKDLNIFKHMFGSLPN